MQEPAKRFTQFMDQFSLPSYFQLNDYCDYIISHGTELENPSFLLAGKVIKIHFSESKVLYDLEFTTEINHEKKTRHVTRIYNVDSAFCYARIPERESRDFRYYEKPVEDIPSVPATGYMCHPMTEFPPTFYGNLEGVSRKVVIDSSGNKKDFLIGWYDFDSRIWCIEGDTSLYEEKHALWMDILPLE